jgi:putative transposase
VPSDYWYGILLGCAPSLLIVVIASRVEIISHSVWLFFRFALCFRDVEEMLAQRGVVLTYETILAWCLKFGQTYANDLRRRSPRPGDKWYLDEVFLKINGSIIRIEP